MDDRASSTFCIMMYPMLFWHWHKTEMLPIMLKLLEYRPQIE